MSVAENLMEDAVLTDFDPNMVACGRAVKQTVRLTFGCWRYRGTFDQRGGHHQGWWCHG